MDIIFYLTADDVNASVVDLYGQAAASPTITRGLRPTLKIRPVHADGTPFTAAELNFPAWDFILADDWDPTTVGQIRVQTGITVGIVQVMVDDVSTPFAEISVPLTDTNTTELVAKLNNTQVITLGAEIAGILAGESDPDFVLQWDMAVRGRRGVAGTGSPEPLGDGNYSSSQVDALVAACAKQIYPMAVDFTVAQQNVIYTVPTGNLFKPAFGRLLTKALTGFAPGMEYKWLAGATELMPAMESAMAAQYEFDDAVLDPDQYFPAGTEIILEVVTAAPSTTQTGSAQIKGDMVDA